MVISGCLMVHNGMGISLEYDGNINIIYPLVNYYITMEITIFHGKIHYINGDFP